MREGRRKVKIVAAVIFSSATAVALIFGLLVIFVYKGINFEADERLFESAAGFHSTTFYYNGAEDTEADYKPVAIEISGSMRKLIYSTDEISQYIKDGFVAVEDKIFYQHSGVDLKRTALAAINYLTRRQKVFGASTITQQVIKNISGDNQITLKRKLGEIIRAIHIERKYTKEEILEVYLNVVPMSENIYGVGAASRAYFGKEPSELLPEEAAMLIGVTNAPTAYNPYLHPDACRKKRNIILSVMRDDGVINQTEYDRAIAAPIKVISREDREDRGDSWFVETVIDEVSADIQEKYGISSSAARMMLLGGGYKVYTTMLPEVQSRLEEYFENTDNFPSEVKDGLNYAMVVTDSESGYLVGLVGRVGEKMGDRLLNHALTPHIPASALKPIALYAPLIDEGRINWATVFDDVPVSFTEQNGEYREYPKNSPAVYDGLISVKDALRRSKNTIAVRLCNIRTPKAVYNSLKRDFGFNTLIEREGGVTDIAVAPMALGQLGRGIPLKKLTEAYSVFTGEGVWREACSYLCLIDYNGRVIIEKDQGRKHIFKSTTAGIMNQMLMTVTEDGTASAVTLKEKVNTAGKTGTSSANRDKVFVGYTPYYTAGIWCGYDRSDISIPTFSKSHIMIWDEILTSLHEDILREGNIREFSTSGLLHLPYCMDSGKLYSSSCILDPRGNRRDFGYFTVDNAPKEECDRHVICKYDCVSKGVATVDCPRQDLVDVALIKVTDRAFPKEIFITDAEFVYRDIVAHTPRPTDQSLPYFYYTISENVFVGKSKREKQFNSNCHSH